MLQMAAQTAAMTAATMPDRFQRGKTSMKGWGETFLRAIALPFVIATISHRWRGIPSRCEVPDTIHQDGGTRSARRERDRARWGGDVLLRQVNLLAGDKLWFQHEPNVHFNCPRASMVSDTLRTIEAAWRLSTRRAGREPL